MRFESLHGPNQVHLEFTDEEDEMGVMFLTGDGGREFREVQRKVLEETMGRRWLGVRGEDSDSPVNHCIGWRDPGFTHGGIVKNLKRVKRYGLKNWQPIREPRADHPNDPIIPQPEQSLYHGGEFGYTRLVAAKETLTLSYVGNHDGEVHDMVEILASGQVASGGTENAAMKPELKKTALSHCEK
ncbi:hypothetical protein Ancab_020807 [Ancistrocladus abbreviatus]